MKGTIEYVVGILILIMQRTINDAWTRVINAPHITFKGKNVEFSGLVQMNHRTRAIINSAAYQ